jgi:hypothetical protein
MDILRVSTAAVILLSGTYIATDNLVFKKKMPVATLNLNAYRITNEEQQEMLKQDMAMLTFEKKPVTQGIIFRIQVLSSEQPVPLNSALFMGCPDVDEYYADGRYNYTVGKFNSPDESNAMFNELENMGFHDTFLVAFKNDSPVPVKQAMCMIKR